MPDELPRRKPWAWLLKHVFEEDVSVCPRCRGHTTWLELATEPDAINRALVNHGLLPPRAPPPPLPQLSCDAQLPFRCDASHRRVDLAAMHPYAPSTMAAAREHFRGRDDAFTAASRPCG